jgi:hypothetical protein
VGVDTALGIVVTVAGEVVKVVGVLTGMRCAVVRTCGADCVSVVRAAEGCCCAFATRVL